MTSVTIQNLTKKFGEFLAVDDVSVDLPDGKFVCMLGPSGCGKTTLLRLVAGLESPTAGRLMVGGVDQSAIPAHQRNFGMVFQSLALFPHLTVAENIAYPLRIRNVNHEKRRARAVELLELVKLPGIGDRHIHQLSGGQRQRVAIARGLAIDPQVFLLDEPLSALDAKLREHMQIELRMLQRQLGVTTIVVTHDQREAMSMADLVIVMDRGKVKQIGTPIEIYRNPANSFVAGFLGMSNLLDCKVLSASSVEVFRHTVELDGEAANNVATGKSAVLSVRPEDVDVKPGDSDQHLSGNVQFIRDLGASVEISTLVNDTEIISVCSPKRRPDVEIGDAIHLVLHTDRATVMAS